MMRIGYYAHHHGSGHCRQADKLAALLPNNARAQLTVFTSLDINSYRFTAIDEQQIVRLNAEDERPDDILAGRAGEYWQPASLHYSPVGNGDIQKRSHQILDTIFQCKIDLMIIDVSVEVAMLCRAASIPYLYVRLPGIRDDAPHLGAFAGALALLAPYPKALESTQTSEWVCDKTLYLDFIYSQQAELYTYESFIDILAKLSMDNETSDLKSTNLPAIETQLTDKSGATIPIITVIKGYGGHKAIDEKLPELRSLLPDTLIVSLGPIDDEKRCYVDISAEVDDVTPFICHSDYLMMACGLNAVAQAYHYDTPLIVVPDDRPHNEQAVMAEALVAQNKALNWHQFKTLMSVNDNQHESIAQTIHGRSKPHPTTSVDSIEKNNIEENNIEENSSEEINAVTPIAAQAFMHSITDYPTTKRWFKNWLLPRLNLTPESTIKD
ncbi:hypothetical protein FQV37_1777 [Psychrobacter nivimaris]|uniref:Glycosyl transferase family 28 C-terminal domain-containing protein n=1 Tax=Psychrobacter nivimaris TaxID=281738 RepID=A0A6N7BXS0_9GAMM|nr:hypothetical protein [Psychrobacter nivimaris]KAF0567826.1 hypothetical protein FQV37_1777 [Psychrobacter nivimaris]